MMILRFLVVAAIVAGASPVRAADYTFNGYRWPGDKPRIPFHIASQTWSSVSQPFVTGADAMAALETAANDWNAVNCNAKFMYRGTTSVTEPANDGINALIVKDEQSPFGGASLAVTHYYHDGTTFLGFDIVFYTIRADGVPSNFAAGIPGPFQMSLPTVARHEFGHAIGLDHSTAAQSVMTPGAYGWVAFPNPDDTAGVQALYDAYDGEGFTAVPSQPTLGGSVALELDYESSAGKDYFVLWSLISADGLPLSPVWPGDSRLLLVNAPFLPTLGSVTLDFVGKLNGQGRATATLDLPPVSFPGLQLHFAAVTFNKPLAVPIPVNQIVDSSVLVSITLP
jgi:hypothetical protein